MSEDGYDNLSEEKPVGEIKDEFIPEDAWPVCPKCFSPCHPSQYYCDNCDSNQPINPLASYIPFVSIRFNYSPFAGIWRKIWHDKDISLIQKCFYLLMIIMFVPVILVFGLPLFLIGKIKDSRSRKVTTITFYSILILLLAIYLLNLIFG